MFLELTDIVDLIKKPRKKNEIEAGKVYESRLRILTEVKNETELKSEEAFSIYKKNLRDRLSKTKADRIEKFIVYPLPVVNITTSVLKELYKVFDARNSFFNIDFGESNSRQYIEPIIKENEVVKWIIEEGKEVLKNEPNKIVVVDKNLEGKPYLLEVCSKRIVDFEEDEDGQLEYIIFIHSTSNENGSPVINYSVYDSEFYRVVQCYNNNYTIISENPHNLGYCPARFFISESLNSNSDYSRKIPLADALSKLEEWQNFDTFKHYVDYYAPFPVMEAPENDCSVENCVNGSLHNPMDYEEDGIIKTRTIISDCPSCSKRDLIGPGTIIRIPAKQDKDDPSEAGVFKMISNDVQNLNYLKEKLNEIETYIFEKVVGLSPKLEKQAINELQVESSYDTRQNVLISLKSELDNLYIWIVETIIKLANQNTEVNISANFGTEFYLLSEEDLQKRFENAKKIGLPEIEIDSIFRQLLDTKYKGNQGKIDRSLMLKYIDPAPYKTIEQCIALFDKGLLNQTDLILKVELINFVDRFEMENLSLNEFGVNLEPYERVKKIKEIFKGYVNEKAS